MEASKQQFKTFESVRMSGKTDMFNMDALLQASGLPERAIVDLITQYTHYHMRYGTFEVPKGTSNGEIRMCMLIYAHHDDLSRMFSNKKLPELSGATGWGVANEDGDFLEVLTREQDRAPDLSAEQAAMWYLTSNSAKAVQAFYNAIVSLRRERFDKNAAS